jgi:hypothetical protein
MLLTIFILPEQHFDVQPSKSDCVLKKSMLLIYLYCAQQLQQTPFGAG